MKTDGKAWFGWLLGGVVVLALVGLASLLEWREEEVDRGYSQAAQRNPFLAAERFLQQQGVAAHSVQGQVWLETLPDPVGATLVMIANEQGLSPHRIDNLWRWVEQGGHLIIHPVGPTRPDPAKRSDSLLTRLGVEVYASDGGRISSSVAPRWLQSLAWPGGRCREEAQLLTLETTDGDSLAIEQRSTLHLVDSGERAKAAAVDSVGARLLQYEVEQGRITIATDLGLWSNGRIGCADHAYLLWRLSGGGEVWFLHHLAMPSLLALLWRHAALALSLFGLLLGLWLWRRSRRFGPLLVEEGRQRRSLLEHLHASAMFAWRRGRIAPLVESLRQEIRERMGRYRLDFENLDFERQCAAIAAVSGVEPESVGRAMEGESHPGDPHRLLATVQQLQRIRKRL